MDMPAIGLKGKPRTVTGNVRRITNGIYRNEGPMARGELADMGPSAVLDTGKVEIAVISRHVEPHDIGSFRALGIDPAKKRYVMLKSRVHWRAGLGPLARAVVECAGEGVCTSDYSQLKFGRVRRPVYPLDPLDPGIPAVRLNPPETCHGCAGFRDESPLLPRKLSHAGLQISRSSAAAGVQRVIGPPHKERS